MNYFLFAGYLLTITATSIGMYKADVSKIKISNARRLKDKFTQQGLADFAVCSGLINRIADKKCDTKGLELAIKTAIINYQFHHSSPILNADYWENVENKTKQIIFGKHY